MKLLDEKEYEKNLRELMETPFGGYHEKPTIIQPEPQPKVIYEQPVENQNTPVSATSQPRIHVIKEQQPVIIKESSPLSLQKTGNAQISLTRLGAVVAVGGAMFGYLYTNNPIIQTETNNLLSKLSTFADNPIIVGSVVVGVLLCTLGLIFRR